MKKLIMTMFAAMFGMAVAVSSASAQTYTFDTTQNQGGSSGSFRVVLQKTGTNTFSVTSIRANPFAGGPAPAPDIPANEVNLTFYTTTFTSGANRDAVTGFVGAPGTFTFGTNTPTGTYSANIQGLSGIKFMENPNTGLGDIQTDGSNYFTTGPGSQITLASGARGVGVSVANGSEAFFGFDVTPETSSWLLLLAALVPVGMVLRRKPSAKMPNAAV